MANGSDKVFLIQAMYALSLELKAKFEIEIYSFALP
jgi:hypothetical protein